MPVTSPLLGVWAVCSDRQNRVEDRNTVGFTTVDASVLAGQSAGPESTPARLRPDADSTPARLRPDPDFGAEGCSRW